MESIKVNYESALGNINKIENNSSENLSENTKKINIFNNKINELNLTLSSYKKKISQLEEELNISISADDLQK